MPSVNLSLIPSETSPLLFWIILSVPHITYLPPSTMYCGCDGLLSSLMSAYTPQIQYTVLIHLSAALYIYRLLYSTHNKLHFSGYRQSNCWMNKLIDELISQLTSTLKWQENGVRTENQKSNNVEAPFFGRLHVLNDNLKASLFPWLYYFHLMYFSPELLITNAIF